MPSSHYTMRTTLSKFVIDHLDRSQAGNEQLVPLLIDLASAVKTISVMTAKGALEGMYGDVDGDSRQGERQGKLDATANAVITEQCCWSGPVAGIVSETSDEPTICPGGNLLQGRYLLVFESLDGSSNVDVNVSMGTIFSVLEYTGKGKPSREDFLQAGCRQVAAGYAIYGPATMLVLTVGKGAHGFTLDREVGNFVLTHPDMAIPPQASELAVNSCNERFWEAPVQRYVEECKAGSAGIRDRDFSMRWVASIVADVHRILMKGGVFMYPRDDRGEHGAGRMRLLHEADPLAFVVEEAGGIASTGRARILDLVPDELHQQVPVMLGSSEELKRIEQYHADYDIGADKPYRSPLFNQRSLYRAEI